MKENREEIVEFLDAIINNDKYIKESQDFILDNFGVKSEYDKETSTIYIWTTNVYESLNVVSASDYLRDTFPPEMLNISFGMKKCGCFSQSNHTTK